MASTITLTGDWLASVGNKYQTNGTGNLGTYATNGVAVSANQVGLGVLEQLIIEPAGGYTFEWVKSTGKVKAYYVAGFTPAGTNSTSAVTGTAAAQTFTGTPVTPTFTGSALAGHTHTFTGDALAAHGHVLFVNDGGASADAEATRLNLSASDGLVSETADTSIPSVADVSGDGGIVNITAGTPAGTNSSTSAGTPAGTISQITPAGTNSPSASLTATAAAQTFTGTAVAAAAGAEVANLTALSGITFRFQATGY